MATAAARRPAPAPEPASAEPETLGEFLRRLGGIPANRVRWQPRPGTATEEDLIRMQDRGEHLFELIDGTLVEKTMGFEESEIAAIIIRLLGNFVADRRLGIVAAPDGTVRILPGQVRAPDVAFHGWDRLPGRKRPRQPIPALVPNLAVEVLSKGNTRGEMARKLREYFEAGIRIVWLVDPKTRTVRVHSGPKRSESVLLNAEATLDGGAVLPGFQVRVGELFPTRA